MKRFVVLIVVLCSFSMVGATVASETNTEHTPISEAALSAQTQSSRGVDPGDTAWVLISTALVMLMTPGLAFFYGGMVGRKNVLGILMQCFAMLIFLIWKELRSSVAV